MDDNPYPGINAHLNSFLQTPGTREEASYWPTFHGQTIVQMVITLNLHLPDNYIALNERSFQSRSLEDFVGTLAIQQPRPDVTVFQRQTSAVSTPLAVSTATPTWEAALADVVEPIRQPMAVAIRELVAPRELGRIVTWIELLSPSNKPSGSHYDTYAIKRVEALETDVPLIEIDYLHESRSPLLQLPRYLHDADATPFSIIVSDPRPNWAQGKVQVYGFHIGQPIPAFPLPLAGEERVMFDLNAVYRNTFQTGRWHIFLDYAAVPERFEMYHADDQARIRQVMESLKTDG